MDKVFLQHALFCHVCNRSLYIISVKWNLDEKLYSKGKWYAHVSLWNFSERSTVIPFPHAKAPPARGLKSWPLASRIEAHSVTRLCPGSNVQAVFSR